MCYLRHLVHGSEAEILTKVIQQENGRFVTRPNICRIFFFQLKKSR